MSKQVLKKILIFALLLFLIGLGVAGFRLTNQYKKVAQLDQSELDLKRLKPKPPVEEDCSDVEHMLAKLLRPSRAISKLPPQNRGALTQDEIAIYRLVLLQWRGKDGHPLTLSQETFPLDVLSGPLPCACIKNIEFTSLSVASRSVHTLTREILPRNNIRFLAQDRWGFTYSAMSQEPPRPIPMSDPEHGVFSLSEIAFDKEHHRALVSYSYGCGLECGSGRTLVFEKVGDEWRLAPTECGGWVS